MKEYKKESDEVNDINLAKRTLSSRSRFYRSKILQIF